MLPSPLDGASQPSRRRPPTASWTTSSPAAPSPCPPLWPYEVANALLILWRRKKLTLDEYSEARMLLDQLSVAVDENSPRLAATRIADIARIHELTVYDAAYLDLAVRKQIPLATRDQSMNRAARRLGIPLLL